VGYDTSTKELFVVSSSRKTKQNITPLLLDSTKVYLLEARSFVYKSDVESGVQSGYIAEEVAAVDPCFATYGREDGKPAQIHWNAVQVCVVEELKKLRAEVNALKLFVDPASLVASVVPVAPAALADPEDPEDPEDAPADPVDAPVSAVEAALAAAIAASLAFIPGPKGDRGDKGDPGEPSNFMFRYPLIKSYDQYLIVPELYIDPLAYVETTTFSTFSTSILSSINNLNNKLILVIY
jgi:hypothetical protein